MKYIEQIGYKSSAMVKARLESLAYYPFHLHRDDFEIICVLNGKVTICDSAASYALSYGDVHIFNMNDPHKIVSDDPDNIILTVQINCDYYKQHFEGLHDAYFICDTYAERDLYSIDIKYLRFLLARLFKAYSEKPSDLQLEAQTKELLEFLLDQFRQYVYKQEEGRAANIVRLQNLDYLYKNYERMYRIVDYVFDHYNEKLSLQSIADAEYLSSPHLSRYIKETLGLTFTQLVSLTRCEEASRLLSATKKTVDLIAVQVGFANRKHLAVQFRKWFQQTPSQYRNGILKDLSSDAKVKLRPFDYDFANVILDMYLDEY
ncbi:MAG: AraC family transcriptional regulator [Clostridiales bacterium]|nr:AraC family transcriptional regulator [Clostridiales bacterium]